jgi:hypothetical protein
MEHWSVEKKDINPLAITPIRQCSNAPKLIEIKSTHHELSPFGLRSVNLSWQFYKFEP